MTDSRPPSEDAAPRRPSATPRAETQARTERGDTVAVVRFKDGRPDPAQSCRFVGETRPWCAIHSDWWASEGRCNSAPTQEPSDAI